MSALRLLARKAACVLLAGATVALSAATASAVNGAKTIEPSKAALQAAAQLRDRALQSNDAYDWLAAISTEVGPRQAGSRGDAAGVAWLRDKLTALGFSNVRTPEVIVPHWVRGEASFEVVAPYPQNMVTLAIGGSIGTPEDGITAPVVMVQDVPALQALKREQVEGKIVHFAGRTERTRDGSGARQSRALAPKKAERRRRRSAPSAS
jgi:hypothetical protein